MEGFTVARAHRLREARIELGRQRPDVLLTDLRLPDGEGIELVRELEKPDATEVIIVTGHATVDSAVAALRAGASDYLVKPADLERVQAVLRHAKKTSALQHEIGELRDALRKLGRFGKILGSSPAHAGALRPAEPRRADLGDRAADRRERHRQGARRADAFTSSAGAAKRRSCRSIAARSRRSSSRASCSATSAAASRAPIASTRDSSSAPTAARSSSTRSPRCRWSCR